MASLFWKSQQQQPSSSNRAPTTIFATLSPRQVANKAYSLAIKKLDRDDKRSRPRYNVRERLLLCNTLSRAEQFLQKRTARTNRRVMAFEDDDNDDETTTEDIDLNEHHQHYQHYQQQQQQQQQHQHQQIDHHSPLCQTEEEQLEEDEDEPIVEPPIAPLLSMGNNAFVIPQDEDDFLQYPATTSFLIPNPSDCRLMPSQTHLTASPIASII